MLLGIYKEANQKTLSYGFPSYTNIVIEKPQAYNILKKKTH